MFCVFSDRFEIGILWLMDYGELNSHRIFMMLLPHNREFRYRRHVFLGVTGISVFLAGITSGLNLAPMSAGHRHRSRSRCNHVFLLCVDHTVRPAFSPCASSENPIHKPFNLLSAACYFSSSPGCFTLGAATTLAGYAGREVHIFPSDSRPIGRRSRSASEHFP